jgi:hypothetical protein
VSGKTGGALNVSSIGAVDISRDMVLHQLGVMKQLNLLPVAATSHSGVNTWTTLHGPCDFDDPLAGKKCQAPPLGQDQNSPAYLADVLHDFGLIHCNKLVTTGIGNGLRADVFQDGTPYYFSQRGTSASKRFGSLPTNLADAENLGSQLANSLTETNDYGDARILYTHFNYYNGCALNPSKDNAVHLHELKHLEPFSDAMFAALSNLMYNLDGERKPHQRVWVTPLSTLLRFLQAQRQLAKNVSVENNVVRITPWTDGVTRARFPDPAFVTQDLHGQTFYVADAKTAKVLVGAVAIQALQRNPADFTGRESVTIVDTHCPSVVFDEVDFFETNGRLEPQGASYYFQQRHAYSGRYAAEVQLDKDGKGLVCWKPYLADNHETSHLRFAYKKTNPKSRVILGWSQDGATPQFLATDGDRDGKQGWELPCFEDSEYHEVILDFADMLPAAAGTRKALPRGCLKNLYLGLVGEAGDSIFFDNIEFLSARGVRPHTGSGLLVGGRIHPPRDGETVRLKIAGSVREAITDRGGWYFFPGVPVGSVVEITYQRGGVTYWPARGRVAQIGKNDVEYHVFALDPRSPSIPRPEFGDQKVPQALGVQCTTASEKTCANLYEPHTRRFYANNVGATFAYIVEDWVNNRGWFDKDRRPENPDGSLRLFLHGTCLEEGAQTPVRDHLNVILESILRRRTGLNVEVALASHSNSSIAPNSMLYEDYGRSLKPDFVILMNDPVNMWHLEPSLLEQNIGWVKGHSPYRGFDFDENGQLVEYPPDPSYPVFAKKPSPTQLVNNIGIGQAYFLLSDYPPQVERSFQLFQAIAKERYVKSLEGYGGRLVVAAGYIGSHYPNPARFEGKGIHQLSAKKYLREMRKVTEAAGGLFVDLSSHVLKYDFGEVLSYGSADGHFSPCGHYVVANALADRLLELPEFQQVVERKKKQVVATAR